ncbi:uncharacterized protein LOC125177622 [Hyalella azteca]|uniref:Uncharacterized protein LOC125177622 n=1 Tax=Hyalella azteca TaxID=294128 RepID=A0A979FH74_HYAAZ|nr:uncharacterized protein LOC125177622 [Hyalella azteca]
MQRRGVLLRRHTSAHVTHHFAHCKNTDKEPQSEEVIDGDENEIFGDEKTEESFSSCSDSEDSKNEREKPEALGMMYEFECGHVTPCSLAHKHHAQPNIGYSYVLQVTNELSDNDDENNKTKYDREKSKNNEEPGTSEGDEDSCGSPSNPSVSSIEIIKDDFVEDS